MKKNLLLALLSILLLSIVSTNLSHRVVLLDSVETRLNLMIGFKIPPGITRQPEELGAHGQLSFHNKKLTSVHIPRLDLYGGNLKTSISPSTYLPEITIYALKYTSEIQTPSSSPKISPLKTSKPSQPGKTARKRIGCTPGQYH